MEYKLSVIVPVYNTELYLDKCLESLKNQSLSDIEIIIVDDGSTDGSEKIAKRYVNENSNFYYYYKKNGGLSSARNYGIQKAKAEYIGFVDSDDWVDSKMFELLYKRIIENKSDISICGINYIYEDGSIKNSELGVKKERNVSSTEALKTMFIGNEFRCHAVNKLYKKELFENIQFPNGKFVEDVFTMYRLIDKATKVTLIKPKLYYYLQARKDSIVNTKFNVKFFEMFDALSEIEKYFNERELFNEIKEEYMCFQIKNISNIARLLALSYNNMNTKERNEYWNIYISYCEKNLYKNWRKNKYLNRKEILRIILSRINFRVYKIIECDLRRVM